MDLLTLQKLNKFWQEKFDRKHPETARRRKLKDRQSLQGLPGVNDLCPKCGRVFDGSTHSYSGLGGFECLQVQAEANKSGGRKGEKKSRSIRSRKTTYVD